MTLDIKKYLKNLIDKEAEISHFKIQVFVGKKTSLKNDKLLAIKKEYGDSFLEDADYIIFFKKLEAWTSKDVNKVFELTDRALGQDANKLTKSDFKKFVSSQSNESTIQTEDFDNSSVEDDLERNDDVEDFSDDDYQTQSVSENILFLKVNLK